MGKKLNENTPMANKLPIIFNLFFIEAHILFQRFLYYARSEKKQTKKERLNASLL